MGAVFTSADPQPVTSAPYAISGATAAAGGAPPARGRISLVALTGAGYDPARRPLEGSSLCGLLLDEWPEQIPNRVESTALVFQHKEPTARAPQALLLAVSPTGQGSWTENDCELLRTILEETLDLAKVRTVDLASLENGGQVLPALYLASNIQGDTVTADWPGIPVAAILRGLGTETPSEGLSPAAPRK